MKILHIYKTYFPETFGGCEQVIKTLAEYTGIKGIENTLLTLGKVKEISREKMGSLNVIRCPTTISLRSCPMGYQFVSEFKKQVERHDIIHYHFPWPFSECLQVFSNIKKPTLVTYHSDIVRQRILKKIYQPLMRQFLRKVKMIVPTSQNYLESSEDLVDFREKCRVIPLGIDENSYPRVSDDFVKNWQDKVGKGFILFVGVLRYYKGLHILLDALQGTNISVVIAGDGPMRETLKQQAKQLRLENVKFLGRISEEDKMALLSLSKAVILPSHLRSEAFGISLLEGLMLGKPLISTEIGTGTSYVNQGGKTGWVVPGDEVQVLRSAILEVQENEEMVIERGKAARQRFEQLFTAEKMGEGYLEVYGEVIKS